MNRKKFIILILSSFFIDLTLKFDKKESDIVVVNGWIFSKAEDDF